MDAHRSSTSAERVGTEQDDGRLVALVRDGHDDAYAELFRRYRPVALRLARRIGTPADADDAVAEAFAQALAQLRRGLGPRHTFRAYVLTAVRHEVARRGRLRQRVQPTDDLATIDTVVPFGHGQLDRFERDLVRAAFNALPERWRRVLWYLDVEGLKPHEVSDRLGLTPNSVSALVYRARAGLREAYLAQHVTAGPAAVAGECAQVRSRLAALVRCTAGRRERERIRGHLQRCAPCRAGYRELEDVNARFTVSSAAAGQTVRCVRR